MDYHTSLGRAPAPPLPRRDGIRSLGATGARLGPVSFRSNYPSNARDNEGEDRQTARCNEEGKDGAIEGCRSTLGVLVYPVAVPAHTALLVGSALQGTRRSTSTSQAPSASRDSHRGGDRRRQQPLLRGAVAQLAGPVVAPAVHHAAGPTAGSRRRDRTRLHIIFPHPADYNSQPSLRTQRPSLTDSPPLGRAMRPICQCRSY